MSGRVLRSFGVVALERDTGFGVGGVLLSGGLDVDDAEGADIVKRG